jgi:hypothetical protein
MAGRNNPTGHLATTFRGEKCNSWSAFDQHFHHPIALREKNTR